MNKQKSQILTIVVLSVLAIILIVCILKNNEGFKSSEIHFQKYGFRPADKPFNVSKLDYATLISKYDTRSKRLPGAGTLSWEGDSVLKNKKLMNIMNHLYGRFCPPPRISQMGNYAIYKEQNEMLPDETNN